MQDKLKTIFAYLFISLIINVVALAVKSTFITDYDGSNMITLLVTIFAINVATSNFIISKLNEFKVVSGKSFTKSFSALNSTMIEQILLILLAFVILIIRDSPIIKMVLIVFDIPVSLIIDTLLIFIVIYYLSILWYTGKSMVAINNTENGKKE